jgi:hypothetical protein
LTPITDLIDYADHHILAVWPADCTEQDEVGYAEVRVRGLHG